MKHALIALTTIALFAASCSSGKHEKKVFVLSNGKFTVDESQQNITLDPSNTHTEQQLVFTKGDKVTITVKTPATTHQVSAAGARRGFRAAAGIPMSSR
jgi:archaellum component FlaF (FlaF/FlaG flagellin family)